MATKRTPRKGKTNGNGSHRPRGTGKPRIEEVARMARVAPITVSRVLRGTDAVAADTRERVMKAVDRLGYIPNLSASSLASRRSGIVAVLVPTIAYSMFSETVQGIADALAGIG